MLNCMHTIVNYHAAAAIYLDKRKQGKHKNLFPVKIRITYRRRQKYYATGCHLSQKDFDKVLPINNRLTGELSKTRKEIFRQFNKAQDIIGDLMTFSFAQFEKLLLDQSNTDSTVHTGIKDYIDLLYSEDRASSASTYEMTLNHLSTFRKRLYYEDLTPEFLRAWEKRMGKKLSPGSIGIHMRNLKCVYNVEARKRPFLKTIYPFADYVIPTNQNPKLALTANEIQL